MNKRQVIFCLCFALIALVNNSILGNSFNHSVLVSEEGKPEIIVIENPEIPKEEKEALVILPGFGDSRKGRKKQKRFFSNKGYDLYIPDYKHRKSFDGTIANFSRFFQKHELGKYEKVHIFSYIMGSWVINKFIQKNGKGNIATIVYDRSPLQERAPQVAVDKIPCIAKIYIGKVIFDLSEIAYPSIEQQGILMGIIVESKATSFIRFFKKKTMSYGSIDWQNLEFNQAHDDLIYTWLNHDQMYVRFDIIGADILSFVKNGKFTSEAKREPYDWDVFEKYKE